MHKRTHGVMNEELYFFPEFPISATIKGKPLQGEGVQVLPALLNKKPLFLPSSISKQCCLIETLLWPMQLCQEWPMWLFLAFISHISFNKLQGGIPSSPPALFVLTTLLPGRAGGGNGTGRRSSREFCGLVGTST